MNEADTCRETVIPGLQVSEWSDEQVVSQYFFTDGRVQIVGGAPRRLKRKFADYLLKYRRDTMIAVVEAKAEYKQPGDGLQQAKEYAEILGLPFAYTTNGAGIVEFDYSTGGFNALQLESIQGQFAVGAFSPHAQAGAFFSAFEEVGFFLSLGGEYDLRFGSVPNTGYGSLLLGFGDAAYSVGPPAAAAAP